MLSVSKTVRTIDYETDQNTFVNGMFGSNDMTIYITVSRIDDSENDTFHLSATAVWNTIPMWRMQDGFALAWDGDFALMESTATASYKSMGVTNSKTQLITQSPNAGVGYAVECSHYYAQALDWVRIDAIVSQRDRSGNANVHAAYSHRIVSLGIGNPMDTMIGDTSFSY